MDAAPRHDDLEQFGLLADAVRRRLYDFVAEQRAPVTRDDAAAGAGISRTLAAYHLDKLAEAGLLKIDYARPGGRTGPGSGRPAKQYTRARRELAVSLPPRNYRLLAHILADAATAAGGADAGPIQASPIRVAEQTGRTLGVEAGELPAALTAAGYEPIADDDGDLVLRNCPFHSIAQEHTDIVCTLNHAVIRGALTGVGDDPDRAELDPCEGRCCVVIRPGAERD